MAVHHADDAARRAAKTQSLLVNIRKDGAKEI